MKQLAVEKHEAGDLVFVTRLAAGVEHVEEVAVQGQTDWAPAFGVDFLGEQQAVGPSAQDGKLVASRVAGKEPLAIGAQDQRALVSETSACASTSGVKHAGWRERAVGGTVVGKDMVGIGGIVHRE